MLIEKVYYNKKSNSKKHFKAITFDHSDTISIIYIIFIII